MKKVFSLLLALIMVSSAFNYSVFAAEAESSDNSNAGVYEVEEWTYEASEPEVMLSMFSDDAEMVLAEDGGSASDIVKVNVTAKNKSTGVEEPVPGATVRLYVGLTERKTAKTNSDGVATLSLSGLSLEERLNATVSADKVVSVGEAVDGTARNPLFSYFPKDTSDIDGDGDRSEYIRYQTELHSEWIDEHGNWRGEPLPESVESNKIDMVFVIDATGSMGDEINNVKNNVAAFSKNLIDKGLDIRFSIIEYRDITCGEPLIIHEVSASHWYRNIDAVTSVLGNIRATGGGDGPETAVDALGAVADSSMNWRSDAHKFAFVLTDADYKVDNNYGYKSFTEVVDALEALGVVTSVITSTYYNGTYRYLYEKTNGIFANISSSGFDAQMLALSDSIATSVTREVDLTLSEPRLLVNLSVSYYCPNKKDDTKYKNAIVELMKEASQTIAQATDGHVFINEVITERTSNRRDFYVSGEAGINSMADIKIEAYDGENVTIGPNAHIDGFYNTSRFGAGKDKFSLLSEGEIEDHFEGRQQFCRIQFSINNNRYGGSLFDAHGKYNVKGDYDKTLVHELGHYLLGLYDEYLDGNGKRFGVRPAGAQENFGLMDSQYKDIELSIPEDYAYLTASSTAGEKTQQYAIHGVSAHSFAANRVENGYKNIMTAGKYEATYTLPDGGHRYASYPAAANVKHNAIPMGAAASLSSDDGEYVASEKSDAFVADVTFDVDSDNISVIINTDSEEVYLYETMSGTPESVELSKTENSYTGKIAAADFDDFEFEVVVKDGDEYYSNTYCLTSSKTIENGLFYQSLNNKVVAYFKNNSAESGLVAATDASVSHDDYVSVNDITIFNSKSGINSGEIYSVANKDLDIDYSTLSWFYNGGEAWEKLETVVSSEEDLNIGALANLKGNGMYALMAKKASDEKNSAVDEVKYEQSDVIDAVVTLTFDDPNEDTKFYNVYYSEEEFEEITDDGEIYRKTFSADEEITLDLRDSESVYAVIETVSETGVKSGLSDMVLLEAGEADSDGDGIPDWYCDEYGLWGEIGEEKNIAESDDDGDGLTNLEEYLGGSDPTNPNDPEHTTNIAVETVEVTPDSKKVKVGSKIKLTAIITPENATNKNIIWSVEDESIATITTDGNVCTVKGVDEGVTTVYAVTADGGYSASAEITVTKKSTGKDDDSTGGVKAEYVIAFETNGGTEVSSQKLYLNEKVEKPKNPKKDGYTFVGWYREKYFENEYDFDLKIKHGFTLYAKWEANEERQIVLAIGDKDAMVFGKKVTNDVAPMIKNDRTMLPIRFIAEALGASVRWNERERKVLVVRDDIEIEIYIDSDKAVVNGETVKLDSAAFIENGRTYLPLRFVSENLGAEVEWNGKDRTVTITK